MLTYELLETRLAEWAQTQPAVRAVVSIGSRARGDADRWSDLDVMIFTSQPAHYAADSGWLSGFGEVWVRFLEMMGGEHPEWFVLYDGGIKLDASLMDVKAGDEMLALETLLAQHSHKAVFARGANILYDRLAPPRLLLPQPVTLPAPPTAAEFDAVVSELLLEAATTAKFIARGDFFRAQRWLTEFMRRCLLRLIEWQAYGRDTWYGGRFMERWADRRALAALPDTFALLERDSMIRALAALLDMARWLGEEVAAHFGFSYPAQAHDQIAALAAATVGQ